MYIYIEREREKKMWLVSFIHRVGLAASSLISTWFGIYYGFDIASVFRSCWTRCLHLATCLRKHFGFDRFDQVWVWT